MTVKLPPSIFNDVIGPIMRGPSSSHTAASVRIGRLVWQFMQGNLQNVLVEFEPGGSLATTYSSQGSDIGIAAGLLNLDPADDRLINALQLVQEKGINLQFKISNFEADHPNTYRITAYGREAKKSHTFTFLSTGGGMLELIEIDSLPLEIRGDYHEALFLSELPASGVPAGISQKIEESLPEIDSANMIVNKGFLLLNLKSTAPLSEEAKTFIKNNLPGADSHYLQPVLPVGSHKNIELPFENVNELILAAEKTGKELWELALDYECARGKLQKNEVLALAGEVAKVMCNARDNGLAGTSYDDRILGPQAQKILSGGHILFGGDLIKNLIANITAIMETKSAMGLIVAAPTAGSCAGLPGTLLAAADEAKGGIELLIKGLLASALIGVFIAGQSTFAAEECGCQAECGAGSAMAAAGLVQIAGGTVKQALAASSMAIQNINGLVCDPVANRVEVPCLGKNILAGMNALAAANMALAGFDQVVPLDEAIEAFDQVGRMLPAELRCTGKGGLSLTPASRSLQDKLETRLKTGEM